MARLFAPAFAVSSFLLGVAVPQLVQAQSVVFPQAGFFTLQGENSSISSARLTDRYYTNGLRANYTSAVHADSLFSGVANTLFGSPNVRVSYEVTQQIYTPDATHVRVQPKGDEPYAGVLLFNLAAVQDSGTTRSSFGLNLGIIGPSALGEQVQNGFHDLIGQGHNTGWNTQLHDEPVFAANLGRVWRASLGSIGGLEIDALPAVGLTLGTLRSAAEGGVVVRLGQSLANDFGISRIRALSGGDVFGASGSLGWYVFAGGKGSAVLNDITLDGNLFQTSRSVHVTPLVGEIDFGGAVEGDGFRVSYSQALQSETFKGQKGGLHQFGSLALTLLF